MTTKAELIARIAELELENTAYAAELGVARIEKVRSGRSNFKYLTQKVRHDGGVVSHTPNAVDLIRKYYWRNHETMSRKAMVANLISQKFAAGTVKTRISWLETGRDESCYNEAIRARLGLDELEVAA